MARRHTVAILVLAAARGYPPAATPFGEQRAV